MIENSKNTIKIFSTNKNIFSAIKTERKDEIENKFDTENLQNKNTTTIFKIYKDFSKNKIFRINKIRHNVGLRIKNKEYLFESENDKSNKICVKKNRRRNRNIGFKHKQNDCNIDNLNIDCIQDNQNNCNIDHSNITCIQDNQNDCNMNNPNFKCIINNQDCNLECHPEHETDHMFLNKKLSRLDYIQDGINKKKWKKGKFTNFEEQIFFKSFGETNGNWNKIENSLKTRSRYQIRDHALKYFIKLCKDYSIDFTSTRTNKKPHFYYNKPIYKNIDKTNERRILNLDQMSEIDKKFLKYFNNRYEVDFSNTKFENEENRNKILKDLPPLKRKIKLTVDSTKPKKKRNRLKKPRTVYPLTDSIEFKRKTIKKFSKFLNVFYVNLENLKLLNKSFSLNHDFIFENELNSQFVSFLTDLLPCQTNWLVEPLISCYMININTLKNHINWLNTFDDYYDKLLKNVISIDKLISTFKH